MAYILNLTLGCYITDDNNEPDGEFLTNKHVLNTLEDLVDHWNKRHSDSWVDIHHPCRVEHFEVYETLPETMIIGGCNDEGKIPNKVT